MSLLTETRPLLKMPGKRMFEDGDYQSRKTARPFKRSYASVTRNFPSNCGPVVPNREQGSADLSVGEKCAILERDGIVIAAKPLRVFAASDANFEYMNPSVPDDCKVDNVKQIFMAKDEEKLDPAVALGKAQSEYEVRGDVLPQGSGALANLKASSHPLKFARKYPLPKIRKGVTVFRSFPPNCGENRVSFSKIAMDNGMANSEMKPCKAIAEASDKSIEDDDQCFIVGEQLNSVSNENVAKDQYEPGPVTEKTPSKQVEEPYTCDSDWKEGVMDDTEICIITPSEWDQLQSRFKCQNFSKEDMRDESLVEDVGKISEEYSMEGFAEPDTDMKIENYDEESNAKELKNLCIVPYDADKAVVARNEVKEALKLFGELYTKLYREYKAESKGGRVTKQMHIEAAFLLRNQRKWVNVQPIFGHVPGVEVGDEFQFRAQLVMVGLHHQFMYGINYVTVNGKKYANSVVDSGRYENKVLSRDVLVYSGQGGNPRIQNLAEKPEDQKLEGANLALKHSKDANLPVRVIRKTCLRNRYMYIYEGLYTVTNYWQERTQTDKLAFMFEMVRISGQSDGSYQQINESRTSMGYLERSNPTTAIDLSQGKEKTPIHVENAMSNEKPQPFTYITKMKYPDWYHISEPLGCDCIDGCSDSKPCYCAYKNGGEIPFNEEGSIIRAKRLVHECGPSCKCPPSCQNRVGQRGPRFPLEVFKTRSTGWGIRSREDIPSGSFICEYIGEVLPDKEAEKRINDEYLFDLDDCDGFTIDAAQYGNVGRFINHSCSPNLYAQNVLYDNDDERLPHIMLFATKKIPALQELTYDYNYKIDRVCDANGNIKKKICHCGSRKCTRRMY